MNISLKDIRLVKGAVEVLKGISFSIPSDSLTCIVGPNGSGKSSVLEIISNNIDDYTGFVTPIDHDQITYLPQTLVPPPFLSTIEVVDLGFYKGKVPKHLRCVNTIELMRLCDVEHIKDVMFDDVSAGEMQRTWLAFALAQSTELVLLDEPLSAIDKPSKRTFFKILRDLADQKKTLVLVTHDIDLAKEFGDHLISIEYGKVSFDGSPSEFQ